MLRVLRGERCLVVYGLVTSFKAEKRKVNVDDAWFQVSPLSLSLSFFLSELEFLVCWCHLPSFDLALLSRNLSFIGVFFLLDQLGFLCFLSRRSRIGRKITFNYLYFLTNFIDISLCAETPFFHFEDSLSNDSAVVGASCNHYFVCMIN